MFIFVFFYCLICRVKLLIFGLKRIIQVVIVDAVVHVATVHVDVVHQLIHHYDEIIRVQDHAPDHALMTKVYVYAIIYVLTMITQTNKGKKKFNHFFFFLPLFIPLLLFLFRFFFLRNITTILSFLSSCEGRRRIINNY